MADPLVVGLIYEVVHDKSVDYSDAETWAGEEPDFRVAVKETKVRFDFNEGYQTVEEAIFTVQPFIDRWEFKASVEFGPGRFALRILRPVVKVQASPDDAQPIIRARLAVATDCYCDNNHQGDEIPHAPNLWTD